MHAPLLVHSKCLLQMMWRQPTGQSPRPPKPRERDPELWEDGSSPLRVPGLRPKPGLMHVASAYAPRDTLQYQPVGDLDYWCASRVTPEFQRRYPAGNWNPCTGRVEYSLAYAVAPWGA